jgi:hypothetical protein
MRALSKCKPGRKKITELRDYFKRKGRADASARFWAEFVSALAHRAAAALPGGVLVSFAQNPIWAVALSAMPIWVLYEVYASSNYLRAVTNADNA